MERMPAEGSGATTPRLPHEHFVHAARRGVAYVRRVLHEAQPRYHRALGRAAALAPAGAVGGLCGVTAQLPFTSEEILLAYAQGLYPLDHGGRIDWMSPDPRGVICLRRALRVPSRVRTYMRKGLYELCFDRDPEAVLRGCGNRPGTWLTPRLQGAYRALFDLGAMHTVEAWKGDRLVGGAFGVSIGTVFTVESMFSDEDHASKLAFAHLGEHLAQRGFTLLDCQYVKEHFARFGAVSIPREEYRRHLALGLMRPAAFHEHQTPRAPSLPVAGAE